MKKLFLTLSLFLSFLIADDLLSSGSCLQFNGESKRIVIDNPVTENFTLEVWVKVANYYTGAGGSDSPAYDGDGILWSDDWGDANDFVLGYNNKYISFWDGSGNTNVRGSEIYNKGWVHIAVTREADEKIYLYLNGQVSGSGDAGASALDANSKISVGANKQDNHWFNGYIDEVRIWNRILTQTEIKDQMHERLRGNESGLVSYWRFDEASGATIKSESGEEAIEVDIDWATSGVEFYPFLSKSTSIVALRKSRSAWGDYDNDGDLDVIVTGIDDKSNYDYYANLYKNDNGKFSIVNTNFTGDYNASPVWGDYDNDGDLDLFILSHRLGLNYKSELFQNNGGSFTKANTNIPGLYEGAAKWFDYDNDGDLDLLISGDQHPSGSDNNYTTLIYRNDNSVFVETKIDIPGLVNPSIDLGDFDNDGDLDILICGKKENDEYITDIYRNDNAVFTEINAGLTGVISGSVDWGDYDSDGDLDILLTGYTESKTFISEVYQNDNGTFSNIDAGLVGVAASDAAWGDFDSDGDLDILLSGYIPPDTYESRVYSNENGSFSEYDAGINAIGYGSVAWVDYDNDDDLDIYINGTTGSGAYVQLYKNLLYNNNTKPSAPSGLSADYDGDKVYFSWNQAADTQTKQDGLTYNLRIGTSSSSCEIMSSMSGSSGTRKIIGMGNTSQSKDWFIDNIDPSQTYYWAVQAVDNHFTGSSWSSVQTLDASFFKYAPEASLTKVENNDDNSVIVSGIVCPNGLDTDYHFNFGTDPDNMNQATEENAGSSFSGIEVSTELNDLTSNTYYYYNIEATNSRGTTTSDTQIFYVNGDVPSENLVLRMRPDVGISESSGKISEWDDLSNNSHHATQSTSSERPVLQTNSINGYSAVHFDGTNSLILPTTSDIGIQNNDYELFIVARSLSASTQYLISGDDKNYALQINGSAGTVFSPNSSNVITKGVDKDYSNEKVHLFSCRVTSYGGTIRVNGIDGDILTSNLQSNSNKTICIGKLSNGSNYFSGEIAEILLYDTDLTESDRSKVEQYLMNRYDLTRGNKPIVSKIKTSNITATSVTLNAIINPEGLASEYFFSYGTDPDNMENKTDIVSLDAGTEDIIIDYNISDISSDEVYYYTLAVNNAKGSVILDIQSYYYNDDIITDDLVLHLQADKGVISSNNKVNRWIDLSNNGNNAYQESDSSRPEPGLCKFNNQKVILFSGSNYMTLPATSQLNIQNSDYEVFFVGQTQSADKQFIMSCAKGYGEIYINQEAGARILPVSGKQSSIGEDGDYADGKPHIFSWQASSSGGNIRVDGFDGYQLTDNIRSSVDDELIIGKRCDDTYYFDGEVAEVIIYNRVLSEDEREEVEKYLAFKHKISNLISPLVTIGEATDITANSATLNATINPNGLATEYKFKYGTNPENLTNSTPTQNIAAGTSDIEITAEISGLSANTLYYFAVEATNENGTNVLDLAVLYIDETMPSEGLVVRLRASDGIYQYDGKVTKWYDISNKNNHSCDKITSSRPVLINNSVNSQPAVHFDGSTDLILPKTSQLGIQNSDYEVFIVGQSNSEKTQFLISCKKGYNEFYINREAGARILPVSGKLSSIGENGDYADGKPHIFSWQASSSGGSIRVDGIDGDQLTDDICSDADDYLIIGKRCYDTYTYYFDGEIAEIIIYNRVLTDDERSDVEDYLHKRYFEDDQSLSVELSSFSVTSDNQSVILGWEVESETNNAGYIIERKSENIDDYIEIASYLKNSELVGKGSISTSQQYSFIDNKVEYGQTYTYRLSDVSESGKITQHAPIEITLEDAPELTKMTPAYPNPFNPSTYIAYSLKTNEKVNISVFDIRGRKIQTLFQGNQSAGNYHVYWNADNFNGTRVPCGPYFIRMQTNNDVQIQKVLLMK